MTKKTTKHEELMYKMGSMESTLEYIKKHVERAPTIEEFEEVRRDVSNLAEDVKRLDGFTQRWKGAAMVILGLGGVIGGVASWIVESLDKLSKIIH